MYMFGCSYLMFVISKALYAQIVVIIISNDDVIAGNDAESVGDVTPAISNVHLSFGNTTDQIVVMWETNSSGDFLVRYAESSRLAFAEAPKGECILFGDNHLRHKRFIHRVVLDHLKGNKRYHYQIVARKAGKNPGGKLFSFYVFSDVHGVLRPGKSHHFLVYGDMGVRSQTIPFVVQESLNRNYTAVFHIGDIAYDLHTFDGAVGDKFLSLIETMAAHVPYLTVPGDHEGFDHYEHYRHRFSMPKLGWPMSAQKLWYSMDIGFAHFIMLVTEHFILEDHSAQLQLDWLKINLIQANYNRKKRPWVIVVMHRPLYCSVEDTFEDCTRENSKVREKLEDNFFEGGVDLVLSGHEHCYERTWPMFKKRVFAYNYKNAPAPVHIIAGTFGYMYIQDKIKLPRPHWSAFASSDPSMELFGRLSIYNSSHLFWEAVHAENDEQFDKMWLIKFNHGPYNISEIFPKRGQPPMVYRKSLKDVEKLATKDLHDYTSRKYVVVICVFSFLGLIALFKKKIISILSSICMISYRSCRL